MLVAVMAVVIIVIAVFIEDLINVTTLVHRVIKTDVKASRIPMTTRAG